MLTIKDPFDKPHNPGRAYARDKPTYMHQFDKAYNCLDNQRRASIEAMFTGRLGFDLSLLRSKWVLKSEPNSGIVGAVQEERMGF